MSRKVQDDLTDREIPPAMLEKLLLRKLDMLERDYLMTVNAQRKPEVIEVRSDSYLSLGSVNAVQVLSSCHFV